MLDKNHLHYSIVVRKLVFIWKKVQIGVKAVGNILQSTKCMTNESFFFEEFSRSIFCTSHECCVHLIVHFRYS